MLDAQTYTTDTVIEVDRLVVRAGAHVRVAGGALLWVRARELLVEGDAEIDARGAPGDDRIPWTSSGYCTVAHQRYLEAAEYPNRATDVGGPGGPGGNVEIRYRALASGSVAAARLIVDADGGPGGAGTEFRCGCHHGETSYGPQGATGPAGAYRLVFE